MPDADATREMQGMPGLRYAVLPQQATGSPDDWAKLVTVCVDALTKPLTDDERKAGKIQPTAPPRIAMTGTLEEVQNYFMENKWGDGLPIIPPTEELVQDFLKNTSHAPDEVVNNTFWPEQWLATVEKVAIVGAMAGCRPEYMPVLLAATEAFGVDAMSSGPRSTQNFNFVIFVNGSIRNEIGMQARENALGPCNRANATIGRFLRLALINLGGSWPGVNEMSVVGNPTKYTFCFAENEEDSPWEPYSVSAGFKPKESTVTICNGGWAHMGNFMGKSLDAIAKAAVNFEWRNGLLLIFDVSRARRHASEGMTKQDVEQYIWEHATTTFAEFKTNWYSLPLGMWKAVPQYGETDLWPDYRSLPDNAMVQAYPRKYVKVVVVGANQQSQCQIWKESYFTTRSVDKWR